MTADVLAMVGPLRESNAFTARGNGVRDVRCPKCSAPLAVHHYLYGDYLRTIPGKYLVRLPDGTFGKSRGGKVGVPRAIVLSVIDPSFAAHCPTRTCGGLLVRIDYQGAVR